MIRRSSTRRSSKGDLGEKRRRYHVLRFLLVFSFASCTLIFGWPSDGILPLFYLRASEREPILSSREEPEKKTAVSCERSSIHSDVCVLHGDIRSSPSSSSIYIYSEVIPAASQSEKIRPYTRKWDSNLMSSINELELAILDTSARNTHHCDNFYSVPAVVFSAGGFTGNVYHDFNDVIIPLYLTSQRFNREVVFVILEYRPWWLSKYKEILSQLSAYPPVDFFAKNLTHCFSEIIVGLHFHDDLAIDPSLTTPANITIVDFHRLLDNAYCPRIQLSEPQPATPSRPKLVMIFRDGSRAVENENELVKLGEEIGFQVQVLRPDITMELAIIYQTLNSSDAMLGVIGCALTHFLFQNPGDVFIQIVGLGTDWAAEKSYGSPATKMGLNYIPYKIKPWESSLSRIYEKDDPVLTNPEAVANRGWDVTKKLYLDEQKVRLDLNRFSKYLTRAYKYIASRKKLQGKPTFSSGRLGEMGGP